MTLADWMKAYARRKEDLLDAAYHLNYEEFAQAAMKLRDLPSFCGCQECQMTTLSNSPTTAAE